MLYARRSHIPCRGLPLRPDAAPRYLCCRPWYDLRLWIRNVDLKRRSRRTLRRLLPRRRWAIRDRRSSVGLAPDQHPPVWEANNNDCNASGYREQCWGHGQFCKSIHPSYKVLIFLSVIGLLTRLLSPAVSVGPRPSLYQRSCDFTCNGRVRRHLLWDRMGVLPV